MRHHSLLHFEKPVSTATENAENEVTTEVNESPKISIPAKVTNGHVFSATAAILVKDNRGTDRSCRMVLEFLENCPTSCNYPRKSPFFQ